MQSTPPQVQQVAEGTWMHDLASRLFPFPRSLTGSGVRKTLQELARELPGLRIHEVPSGTEVLDWVVPPEWNIAGAHLDGPDGVRVLDWRDSNVHVVSYSIPVDTVLDLRDLDGHLHSDPAIPDAIPYVTSYYNSTWGFCLSETERRSLREGRYHAVIESSLDSGSLTYGDLVIPGELDDEILVTTYVCHPSLGNNELSGPVVATALARWIMSSPRRFTYRFVFAPETIGAITYIAQNQEHLRSNVIAGINLTCIGDDGDWSYLSSRLGNQPLDRIARRVVRTFPRPVEYSYLDRGSDERHYGMPGVGVPMLSLMRTKYGSYPEYHTHLDDLTVITPSGLQGGLDLVRACLEEFEASTYFVSTVLGEPQLGKRGLYHSMHARTVEDVVLLRTHVLAYADGMHSVRDMAELLEIPENEVQQIVDELLAHGLLEESPPGKVPI
jgi:aminopeptidase-like protein